PVGAFYLVGSDGRLRLEAGFALSHERFESSIAPGEGMAGQAALLKKEIITEDISDKSFFVNFTSGKVLPQTVIAYPVLFENKLLGVIELGFLRTLTPLEIDFLKTTSGSIGITITGAQNRLKLQELLEETQSQTEKLQASEEELKVQQEELLETNHAIEERNKLLEDRNQIIAERNLDIQKKA